MNNQSVNRFPKAASISLALLLIAIAVLAGYGETHATPVADSAPITASSDELVWVRQEPAVINGADAPITWEPEHPAYAGSYGQYTLTETKIALHQRYVFHSEEWYDVTMKTIFDRPPIVLNPPLRYKIKATASLSGTYNKGVIGLMFQYRSSKPSVIEPDEPLRFDPFGDWWYTHQYEEWMINPPAIGQEGDTFQITAGWWNCPPCNIAWTYRAEPANAVPRLNVEVVQPVVIYQGEEVPPGQTFYPETCPNTTTQTDEPCDDEQTMKEKAKAHYKCKSGAFERLLMILDLLESDKDDLADFRLKILITNIIAVELERRCEAAKADTYRLDLALDKGAVQLGNVAGGLTTSVKTPLGTAVAAGKGAFMTAFNPDTNAAIFHAYSTPLTLQPKSGPSLALKPNHQVKLTSEGFGPVTELPHLYLPMVTNAR